MKCVMSTAHIKLPFRYSNFLYPEMRSSLDSTWSGACIQTHSSCIGKSAYSDVFLSKSGRPWYCSISLT